MTATEAIAEVKAVAVALAALPGAVGTAGEIAASSGLCPALVLRRLKGASMAMPGRSASRVFRVAEHARERGGKYRGAALWGLTSRGEQLARVEG